MAFLLKVSVKSIRLRTRGIFAQGCPTPQLIAIQPGLSARRKSQRFRLYVANDDSAAS
jgi:hypothetical protein